MAEPARLFNSRYSDDERYYHVIPAGDPVGATGRCTEYLAEVMHLGDTGWVFKDLID